MAQEYSGIATIGDGVTLRVSFVATKYVDADTGRDEFDIIGTVSHTLDGVECDAGLIEELHGRSASASAIERAVENALYAIEVD